MIKPLSLSPASAGGRSAAAKPLKRWTVPAGLKEVCHPVRPFAGLTLAEQNIFETGGSVFYNNVLERYWLVELLSGASTMLALPVSQEKYSAYLDWQAQEGMPKVDQAEAAFHLGAVRARLSKHGLLFNFGGELLKPGDPLPPETNGAWRVIEQVLDILPDSLLENKGLKGFDFYGHRQGAAQLSAFIDGIVYLYNGAMKGAKRNLVGLILHEIGHSLVETLSLPEKERLQQAWSLLKEDLIGLHFAGGPEYRRSYQAGSFNEFIAEMTMLYVCAGEQLRTKAAHSTNWQTVYGFFRDRVFDGIEYD